MRCLARIIIKPLAKVMCISRRMLYPVLAGKPKYKLSILLLTWNRSRFLDLAIQAILKNISGRISYEFLIMDNGSTDETRQVLRKYEGLPGVRIIQLSENRGLNSYKKLFRMAQGEILLEVDDDVIQVPKDFDLTFLEYLNRFPDYGYLALNVIQNEMTDGAKPDKSAYEVDDRDGYVIERGPTGGWFSAFRRKDFFVFRPLYNLVPFNFSLSEDGVLAILMDVVLSLKTGLIQSEVCLHACGPYYAKQYGHIDREVEKYEKSGLMDRVKVLKQVSAETTEKEENSHSLPS